MKRTHLSDYVVISPAVIHLYAFCFPGAVLGKCPLASTITFIVL